MTRWWISWASTPRITARPCSSATAAWWAIDASSSRSSSVNGVSRSQTSSPIWRRFQRSGIRTACVRRGPRARRSCRPRARARRRSRDGLHRRLDDRLERLLEVERLRDRLRDLRERLQLVDPPLRLRVELRVLDRLRDLRGDREQQVDLRLRRTRAARCVRTFERALELLARRIGTARIDSYSSSGRFGKCLKRGSRCAWDGIITGARSAAAAPVIPSPGRIRGRRVISSTRVPCVARRTSSPGALVVEVDEAGVGVECLGHLARHEPEHLLEVERRVDGGDRLRQKPQVPLGGVHGTDCRPGGRLGSAR